MLKEIVSIAICLIISNGLFSQDENSGTCSKRTKHTNSLKSASLTVDQIAQSELYDVHFYSLDIAMNNVVTDISGTGEIFGIARVDLDSALFELYSGFFISEIRVNTIPVLYSRVGTAIKVPVDALLGDNFIISIDYTGVPPTASSTPFGGSGMTHTTSPSWGNHVAWSLSEPFSAYEWWPCKQSLRDKADSCSVKITVPDTCKAGSNGLLEAIVPLGNGFTRYEWKHRHPIDYYLVSVAVAKYVDYTIYANPVGAPAPIMIKNYIYDNPATLPNFQTRIDETADFIELYYDLYGPYPFENEKYGHCMAPISGGMEHQTMTTQGFFEKSLTSHELAHQWWGNNVTCASWSDIWLNEGFASYSEHLMLENLYPTEKDQQMLDVHDNVMSQPNGSVWVLDSLNETRIFSGRLTYDKGSGIIHTIRYMINDDELFFNTLREFQIEYDDSVASGIDIRNSFQNASGIDFTPYFEQWYFGQGYPTYSARWNQQGNDLLVELSHIVSMPSVTPTFTNPLDILISRTIGDTIVRLDINTNLDQFQLMNIGTVTAIAIDPNNWVINKVGTVVFDGSLLSIDENKLENNLSIFPNPTNGKITVKGASLENKTYLIYRMNGQEIANGTFSNTNTIDLSSFENGTYLIQIGEQRKLVNLVR